MKHDNVAHMRMAKVPIPVVTGIPVPFLKLTSFWLAARLGIRNYVRIRCWTFDVYFFI